MNWKEGYAVERRVKTRSSIERSVSVTISAAEEAVSWDLKEGMGNGTVLFCGVGERGWSC